MKNNKFRPFVKTVILVNTIIMLISIIVLLILQKYSWALGYLLGALVSDITFIMHAFNVSKFGVKSINPVKSSVSSTLLRTLISAVALLIAFTVDFIDIFATFIGLVVIKIVIIITSLIVFRKVNHKIEGGDVREK